MKPAPFQYFTPLRVDEVLDLLHQGGGEAKVLAGGQSLLPLLNFRLVKPGALIDINGVNELSYIRPANGSLAIGAIARQKEVLASPEVQRQCSLVSEALAYVGHTATRNRGTVCGSIAHADPAGEMPVVATALDAAMVLHSANGARTLRPGEFFQTYFTTAMEPDELLAEVQFPVLGPRTGSAFLEVSRRQGDFAIVAVAAVVTLNESGRVQKASVALGGVGGVPVRAAAVERALSGAEPTANALAESAALVKGEIEPEDDIQASAEYRKDVAAVLVRRGLQAAVDRARGPAPRGGRRRARRSA